MISSSRNQPGNALVVPTALASAKASSAYRGLGWKRAPREHEEFECEKWILLRCKCVGIHMEALLFRHTPGLISVRREKTLVKWL